MARVAMGPPKLKSVNLAPGEIDRVIELLKEIKPELELGNKRFIKDLHIYIRDGDIFCDVVYFEEKEDESIYTKVFEAPLGSDGPAMQEIFGNSHRMDEDHNMRSIEYSQNETTFYQTITYFKDPA